MVLYLHLILKLNIASLSVLLLFFLINRFSVEAARRWNLPITRHIFRHNLRVSSLFWMQSGCYVGADTLTLNCANGELFWGSQGKTCGTHLRSVILSFSHWWTPRLIISAWWASSSGAESSLYLVLQQRPWNQWHKSKAIWDFPIGSSPRNPWARVRPAPRAS